MISTFVDLIVVTGLSLFFILAIVGMFRAFNGWLLKHPALRHILFILGDAFIGGCLGFWLTALAIAFFNPPIVEISISGRTVDWTAFLLLMATICGIICGARSGHHRASEGNSMSLERNVNTSI